MLVADEPEQENDRQQDEHLQDRAAVGFARAFQKIVAQPDQVAQKSEQGQPAADQQVQVNEGVGFLPDQERHEADAQAHQPDQPQNLRELFHQLTSLNSISRSRR